MQLERLSPDRGHILDIDNSSLTSLEEKRCCWRWPVEFIHRLAVITCHRTPTVVAQNNVSLAIIVCVRFPIVVHCYYVAVLCLWNISIHTYDFNSPSVGLEQFKFLIFVDKHMPVLLTRPEDIRPRPRPRPRVIRPWPLAKAPIVIKPMTAPTWTTQTRQTKAHEKLD